MQAYNIKIMTQERLDGRNVFNSDSYIHVLQSYKDALGKGVKSDNASLLVVEMQKDTDMFRESIGKSYFMSTLSFLEDLVKLKRTYGNMELVDSIPSFAQAVLKDLRSCVDENPSAYLMPAYRLARLFEDTKNSGLLTVASGIFAHNLDRLLEAEGISNKEAERLVRQVIPVANEGQLRKLVRDALLPDSTLSRRLASPIDSILNLSILGNNTYDRPRRMAAVLDEISGERSNDLLNAWDDSTGKIKDRTKGSESIYFEEFAIVCQLEKKRPGITKFLIERYGVLNFARYPFNLLVDQYDTRGEKDTPYGIITTARYDNNGIILNDKGQIDNAYRQAKVLSHSLKVFEAERSENLTGILLSSNKNHGKISFLIVMAHGYHDSIALGLDGESVAVNTLHKDEIDDHNALAFLRDVFVPSAKICLISCSTGKKDGIAQKLSLILPDVVHSPDYAAFLKENGIRIEKNGEDVAVRILFGYKEGNFVTEEDIEYALTSSTKGVFNRRTNVENLYDVPTRVYRNGDLINDYTD